MWTSFIIVLLINTLLTSAQVNIISGNSEHFTCFNFGSLESCLEKVEKNTTSLTITDSDISRIPGRAFEKFGALKSLTINSCGLKKIQPYAFTGLINLEKLDLSVNSLNLLESNYFNYLPNLRHLDVSFNEIKAIDDIIFFNLEKLENFYFDYNKVSAMSNRLLERLKSDGPRKLSLRNVKIGRNPMNWEHRMLLTRRFDDLNINYKDDWEDSNWLSSTFRECQENGLMGLPSDQVLNCVIEKLLDFAHENLSTTYTPCVPEATVLMNCFKGNESQLQNIDAVRFAIEGLGSIIKPMEDVHGIFHITPGYKRKLDHQVMHYVAKESDWAWFEDVINSCRNGLYNEEAILDCEVQLLLDFSFSIFNDSQSLDGSSNQTFCNDQVNSLLLCSRFTPVVDDIAVRRALEGFEYILQKMDSSLGKLNEGLL